MYGKDKKHSKNKNYTAVILGEVRSDFKLIVENLDHVRKKGDATFEMVGELQEDMTIVKTDIVILKEDVSVLKKDVGVLKEDVSVLKKDMTEVKEELHVVRKVGRDGFKLLENRVTRLEKARVA